MAAGERADRAAQVREFHLREYEALRAEILVHSDEVMKLAEYAVAASAAVYGFLLTAKAGADPVLPSRLFHFAGTLPIAFAVLGALLSNQQHAQMIKIGRYLARLEAEFGLGGFGWEQSQERRGPRWLGLYGAWAIFWGLMLLATGGGGALFWYAIKV